MSMMYRKNSYGETISIQLMQIDDGPLVIFAAMFESMCQDLATMRKKGMWLDNPREALSHPQIDSLMHDEGCVTCRLVVNEYASEGLKHLSLLIATASRGRVHIGQSCAIRWAKEMSEQKPQTKRLRL